MDSADITTEAFDQAVGELAQKDGVSVLLSIPGVWELVAEFYNNDAIDLCLEGANDDDREADDMDTNGVDDD